MKQELSPTSPCISVCALSERTGYCKGCYRTIQEMAEWEYCDDTRKREMLEILAKRKTEDKDKYNY